jgi:hypothetical protein
LQLPHCQQAFLFELITFFHLSACRIIYPYILL